MKKLLLMTIVMGFAVSTFSQCYRYSFITDTDKEAWQDIVEQLSVDPRFSSLRVKVDNGVAVISGLAPDKETIGDALCIASATPYIVKVRSRITRVK